jgi:SAM-dependent methyltransferase
VAISEQKRRGAWYTPDALVELVVDAVVDRAFVDGCAERSVRIVDPACGDGRFLAAAAARVESLGGRSELVGVDSDQGAIEEARRVLGGDARLVHADALGDRGPAGHGPFDLVIGNPPYLSQMASSTTRGQASRHGGGPYADAAVEFVALGASIVRPDGGRLAYVLPQSILSARDAQPVRERVDARASMFWSSWTGERDFEAQVLTCALAFEFGRPDERAGSSWSHVVTARAGVPPVPDAMSVSVETLGDRAWLNANFRDEYYGMIPAVGDHESGPPLVTSGLIDPGRSLWGERPVRFAKQRFDAPRIDVSALDEKMQRWASRRLVPKVLVANQTPIIEAVCDADGAWLPGVPVVSVYPEHADAETAWQIAAVLTSPAASAWAWHERGGSGLSANTIRVGPVMLAALPWPSGGLDAAVAALRAGDVVACGHLIGDAYGVGAEEAAELDAWWLPIVQRIDERSR